MDLNPSDIDEIVSLLLEGKIGVLPTDTVYGIHCLASRNDLLQQVNRIKGREESSPLITLISSVEDLTQFGIELDTTAEKLVNECWPGPNTIIIEKQSFRVPAYEYIQKIIVKTGPLFSTSANTHGNPLATNIEDAKKYLGKTVDFYVDVGELNNTASNMYKIENGLVEKLR